MLSRLGILLALHLLVACGDLGTDKKKSSSNDWIPWVDPSPAGVDPVVTSNPTPGIEGNTNIEESEKVIVGGTLGSFESNEAFNLFAQEILKKSVSRSQKNTITNSEAFEDSVAADTSGAESSASNEEITNNQEQGVDEGGIVKNIGPYLVVLRKGRLFSYHTEERKQEDSMAVAATKSLNGQVWYDEMLVKGSMLYVIGYRYSALPSDLQPHQIPMIGSTEINSYRLENGKFIRLSTKFIESNDYFSSGNYASRMVDGKLVFYMPFSGKAYFNSNYRVHIPRVFELIKGGRVQYIGELYSGVDIYNEIGNDKAMVFHTLTHCDLPETGAINCSAKALMGNYGNQFYVSKNFVYLWLSSGVYAFGLKTHSLSVHKTSGSPIDQLSFQERDQVLHVLLRNYTKSGSPLELHSLPLIAFNHIGNQESNTIKVALSKNAEPSDYRYSYGLKNRWVGNSIVISTQNWENAVSVERKLTIVDAVSGQISELPSSGRVNRIEKMSDTRFLVSSTIKNRLELTSFEIGTSVRALHTFVKEGAIEGETRSHGFSYKRISESQTLMGLPILNISNSRQNWWGEGVSNIAFFIMESDGTFEQKGIISASNDSRGTCETSCVDWYGNTRPIFQRDKIFGLMGSEMVAAELREGKIEKVGESVLFNNEIN